jgi:hypothetical protein
MNGVLEASKAVASLPEPPAALTKPNTLCWIAAAAASFHAAYSSRSLAWLILFYLYALLQLTRVGSPRKAFYALEQKVWDSPWGKLGICICYDLSYARVTDPLITMGAEALIVPTMDVADWGKHQHELHARVGPVRAAEYHVPIFRLASSGISQAINSSGQVITSAPCPGDTAMLAGTLTLGNRGRRPVDRWLAPFSTLVAVGIIFWCAIPQRWLNRKTAGTC